MTKENIAGFFDKAATNKVLAEKIAELATKHGYEFTAEELLELGAARPISDEIAEYAAGRGPTTALNPYGHRRTLPNR